jgi:hypothetical protein
MSLNHNMGPLLLLFNYSFTLLNAELSNKQPTKKEPNYISQGILILEQRVPCVL